MLMRNAVVEQMFLNGIFMSMFFFEPLYPYEKRRTTTCVKNAWLVLSLLMPNYNLFHNNHLSINRGIILQLLANRKLVVFVNSPCCIVSGPTLPPTLW